MNLKNVENHIRGWFPKEPHMPSNNVKLNSEYQKVSKSWRRFLPLFIISYILLVAIQLILYLLAYINVTTLVGGILVLLLIIPLPYAIWYIQTKYQHTKVLHGVNKFVFIGTGAILGFSLTMFATIFIILATGITEPFSALGPLLTIILLAVIPTTTGASIGYLIGKRRNYEPYR